MQIRHIRPRSIEWYDALLENDSRGFERLSPEEKMKLRTLVAQEQASMQVFGPASGAQFGSLQSL